jgi:hypothetical protein
MISAVVVRDLPADVVAVGNPARVIRQLYPRAWGRVDGHLSGQIFRRGLRGSFTGEIGGQPIAGHA